ncbi:MAG: carboxypeptidase-like regulatory domain-containing protein [Planctomycetota bacterium]
MTRRAFPESAAEATCELQVAVSWSDGKPAVGTAVAVRGRRMLGAWRGLIARGVIDETGAVRLHGLPAGKVVVASDRGANAFAELTPGRPAHVTLTLPEGVDVDGSVTESNGRPVAGATLVLSYPKLERAVPVGTTDAEGRYALRGLPVDHALGVRAVGWSPTGRAWFDRETSRSRSIDFVLVHRGGALAGVVVDDGGVPVAGAIVRIEEEDQSGPDAPDGCTSIPSVAPFRVVTDDEGAFRIADAAFGRIALGAEALDLASGEVEVHVEVGQTTRARIVLHAGGVLVGVARRSDGRPAGGARLEIGRRGAFRRTLPALGGDGAFRIAGVPAGFHPISLLDGERGSAHASLEFHHGEETAWHPTLDEHLALEGIVVDEEGRPFVGCEVVARADPAADVRGRTDAQGRFRLERVSPLCDRLDVRPSGGFGARTVSVDDPLEMPRPFRIVLAAEDRPSGSLRFRVVHPAGSVFARRVAVVRFRGRSAEGAVRPNIANDGACAIGSLVPGPYELHIQVDGTSAYATRFELRREQVLDLG